MRARRRGTDNVGMRLLVVALVAAPLACSAPPAPPPDVDDDEAPTPDEARTTGDARVDAIARGFDRALDECPERVWAGHDGRGDRIVLRSVSDDAAWVWSGRDVRADGAPSVVAVDPATLPLQLRDFEFFSVDVLDGAPALGVDLDLTAGDWGSYGDMALHLALHEGFHFLGGQDDFSSVDTSARDPAYPMDWRPRFLRDRVVDGLRRAASGDDDGAGAARGHHDRYAAAHADERDALRGLDVIEGTAQYVETIGVLVATLGCDVDDAALLDEARAHLDAFVGDPGFDQGAESYVLGPVAGLLLRAAGVDFVEDAKGAPLHELALADVAPIAVDDDAAAVAAAQGEIDARNAAVAAAIDPLLAAWDDASAPRLALPTSRMIGSFAYAGGYVLVDRDDDAHVMLDVATTFDVDGAAELSGASVLVVDDACGEETFVLPLPGAALVDGRATVAGDAVAVDALAVDVVEAGGASWWCAR